MYSFLHLLASFATSAILFVFCSWFNKILFFFSIFSPFQESAIILAKVLVPQIFERMTLQDLRALVAERSSMKKYIRGETIEVPYQSIGFLLEGFIKPFSVQEELISSPAVLLPSHGNQSFLNADMSGNFIVLFIKLYVL